MLGDSQMKRLLRAWAGNNGSRQKKMTAHCAESGWTTTELKIAIRQNHTSFNSICFVLIGLNDILQKVPITTVKSNILSIVNILTTSGKSVLISTLPPTLDRIDKRQSEIKIINIFIQSLQTKPNVSVITFHKQFPPFSSNNLDLYQLSYANGRPDKLHLSINGFQLLISLIREVLPPGPHH